MNNQNESYIKLSKDGDSYSEDIQGLTGIEIVNYLLSELVSFCGDDLNMPIEIFAETLTKAILKYGDKKISEHAELSDQISDKQAAALIKRVIDLTNDK